MISNYSIPCPFDLHGEKWTLKATAAPTVIRNCSKCKCSRPFVCSGNFRMNANGKNVDVWLIYKCQECDSTWNMEIFSRVKSNQLENTLRESFLKNDRVTAMRYAFDAQILSKNKAVVCQEDAAYMVEKVYECGHFGQLEISLPPGLNLRLDKLLSDQLELSRTLIKRLFENGILACTDPNITMKSKVSGTIKLIWKET